MDAVLLTRYDNTIFYANSVAEELFGFTKQEMYELGWERFIDIEVGQLSELFEKLSSTGKARGELVFVKEDGSKFPGEISCNIIEENENILGSISIVRDLTEKKLAEQQIQYHSLLLSDVSDAIVGSDTNFRVNYWNKAAEQIYGYSKTEAIGRAIKDFVRPTYAPGERETIIDELNHTGKYNRIIGTKHRDGNEIITEVNSIKIMDEYGNTLGYVMVYRDITELKHEEKRKNELLENEQQLTEELQTSNEELRCTTEELQSANIELQKQRDKLLRVNQALIESEDKFYKSFYSNPAAMSLSDGVKWIDVNESYLKLTGYRREELIDHKPSELNFIDNEKRKRYLTEAQKNSIKDMELEIRTKSGAKRTVISRTEHIQLDNNVLYINFIHDITERKEREILSNTLNTMNKYINSTLEYDEIMQMIVEEGAKAVDAESSVINLFEGDKWIAKYVYNFPDNILGMVKSGKESPISVYVANKRKAVVFNDAQNDSIVNKDQMKLHGISSILVAPIILKDRVMGIIAFYHHQRSTKFSKAQIDFVNKLASSLSQSIENAQLFSKIRKREEKYRSILDNIQDAYIQTDKEGKIVLANPSAAQMYRFDSTHEMMGIPVVTLFKNHEDMIKLQEKLDKYGKVENFEILSLRRDGSTFFGSQNTQFYYDDKGRVQGIEGLIHDVTENKKAAEESLMHRKLLDAINKVFEESLTTETESEIIQKCLEAAEELTESQIGFFGEINQNGRLDDRALTPPAWEMCETPNAHELLKDMEIVSYWGRTIKEERSQIVNQPDSDPDRRGLPKGHPPITSFLGVPLKKGGKTIGMIALANKKSGYDQTDKTNIEALSVAFVEVLMRKKAEIEIKENMKNLARSNKELEQFAYITSHDLREPLRMITSFLQLLERRYKDQLDQDANDFIEFAVNGAKRMDNMTNDLLQYSKITTNKRELTDVNFENVLKDALINLKVKIEENNAVITHDPLPTIRGDAQLKVQLFQNIIGNAIKYRGEETPKIHISAKKEKNLYLFCIKDNGIGMSHEHLERIFTNLQRLHTHEEYEGTGIGLAIAQKIVLQQGGEIWAESELGVGSTFYFTIPITDLSPTTAK